MAESETSSRLKVMLAATLGSTLEWYDFFIFGASSVLVFYRVFYPPGDAFVATMLSLGAFAVGFLARPFGGIVFGLIGDRIGRKHTLVVSLLMMGFATLAIGLLPGYDTIGVAAPIILVLIRIVQGIAVGGEATGALTLVAESMAPAHRGFWTAFPMASGPAANVLALGLLGLLQFTLGETEYMSWGWRIPFLLSIVLIAIGFWARRRVDESPAFQAIKTAKAVAAFPLAVALSDQKLPMARVFFIKAAENTLLYLFSTFALLFATKWLALTAAQAVDIVLVASALSLPAILGAGWLSDRIGRRSVMLAGLLLAVASAFWLFTATHGATPGELQLRVILCLCTHGLLLGGLAPFVTESFPTAVRYTALSASYQAASVLGGSVAPLIGAWLLQRTGTPLSVAIYAGVMAIPAIIVIALAGETRGSDIEAVRSEI